MTPLAQRIAREITLPRKRRTFDDQAGIIPHMGDIHCFECSEVFDLAKQIGLLGINGNIDERSSFLPAPKTWIEFTFFGVRTGMLLIDTTDELGRPAASVVISVDTHSYDFGELSLTDNVGRGEILKRPSYGLFIYGFLALINTPKIIGRRQHMPHRGFEREMVRAMKGVGKFPLHAWTEIKLEVTPPKDASGEPSVEVHLTGKRALHFCRAHLRIRCGKVEMVRSHWRGDGFLGIKRSRYKMSAPTMEMAS